MVSLSMDQSNPVAKQYSAYTTTPQSISGFTPPVSLGGATIKKPDSEDTYMGIQTFPQTQ